MSSCLKTKLLMQLGVIYKDVELDISYEQLASQLIEQMGLEQSTPSPKPYQNNWDQSDIVAITYGDSIYREGEKPLQTLDYFVDEYLDDCINSVHILPFFPYSSDDGFSVLDYSSVNEALGDWSDISRIASKRKLMADLVINHCSSRSVWFNNFIKGSGTGHDYFFTANKDAPIEQVVRPRTSPLLRQVSTEKGEQYVWCTFSHDQVDLDFSNPNVLLTFISIIKQYLDAGVLIFRLDAVAFLWKEIGTDCINLPQTHEVVRLIRTLVEHANPKAMLITETNIPLTQNLAYFGNANEAHCIYNFSLPPLLIHTLISGDCTALQNWLIRMPPAQNGTAYFNFIASHDGIGLRPAEGLLSEIDITRMVNTMQAFGGLISWRTGQNSVQKPYEMNIALYDALKGTLNGEDKHNFSRFICAHCIMLSLEGIPGIYIHSLLATQNDYEKFEHTNHNRAINRHRWHYDQLSDLLNNKYSHHQKVLAELKRIIAIRIAQDAFHPNAIQVVLQLGNNLFGVMRQCHNDQQTVFCIANICDENQKLRLSELNLSNSNAWYDLLSGASIENIHGEYHLTPYQVLWLTNNKSILEH